MVIAVLLGVAIASGALVACAVLRWPTVDPASPRATSSAVRHELRTSPRFRRFMLGRVDPGAATGLLLSIAVLIVIVGAVAVGILFWMMRENTGIARADLRLARWGASSATELSTDILKLVTDAGSTVVVIVVTAIVAAVEYRRLPTHALVPFLVLVVAGQNVITNLVKLVVERARPDIDPLAAFAGSSFPSGHSASAAATYAACALVVGRARGSSVQAYLAGLAAAIAVAVATSRVLLGVHWFTDVLAGLALGYAWFAACAIAFGGRLLHFGAPVELAERVTARAGAPDERERAAG
jgi:undecaprenyl-diphosphatase